MCICYFQSLSLFCCIWRWGLSRGKQELQVHFGDAPPSTCSQLALPQDTPVLASEPVGLQGCDTASHYGLQGCDTASHYALRGIELDYPFCFICFHPII